VEIEPAMVEGARRFGPMVARAFDDPRSHLHIEDAKTFFSSSPQLYDVIVSEPSNPWVSGVASLFSREFYAQARRRLKPGGLFVQWLQLYQIDMPLVSTVMRALDEQFDDYVVAIPSTLDAIIVASPQGAVPPLRPAIFAEPGVAELLHWLGIDSLQDLQLRMIGRKPRLAPFFESYGMPTNSDYFPVLDQNALKRRFKEAVASDMEAVQEVNLEIDGLPEGQFAHSRVFRNAGRAAEAQSLGTYLRAAHPVRNGEALPELVEELRNLGAICANSGAEAAWLQRYVALLDYLPYFDPATAQATATYIAPVKCEHPRAADRWSAFLAAAGRMEWARAAEIGAELVPPGVATSPSPMIARELLIADVQSGNLAQARKRLEGWRGRFADNTAIRFLQANLENKR